MYKVEVRVAGEQKFCGNALTFETAEKAKAYAEDLFSRWTAVEEYRVVDADPINITELAEFFPDK